MKSHGKPVVIAVLKIRCRTGSSHPSASRPSVFFAVLAFNLMGDGLHDALDPRSW
jgi:hypothetical protein